MCLNRSFAHARGVMNGLLMDVSASRLSLHFFCSGSFFIVLQACYVCFEGARFQASAVPS